MVVFGASGDLTRRKIMPALYALAFRRLLPESFGIVGCARSEMTDEQFVEAMEAAVREFARDEFRSEVWEALASGMRYVPMEFSDDEDEDRLARCLRELDEQ